MITLLQFILTTCTAQASCGDVHVTDTCRLQSYPPATQGDTVQLTTVQLQYLYYTTVPVPAVLQPTVPHCHPRMETVCKMTILVAKHLHRLRRVREHTSLAACGDFPGGPCQGPGR